VKIRGTRVACRERQPLKKNLPTIKSGSLVSSVNFAVGGDFRRDGKIE
jgi:hypothetical protein